MKTESGVYILELGSGNVDLVRDPSRPSRIAAVKVGNTCNEGTLAHQVYVCSKILNLQVDDRRPPVLEERQPIATCSPLGDTVGSHRNCSGGGLFIDACNTTEDALLVRSHISESKEIAPPIPLLEAGKALTMVSASVKLNNTKCEPYAVLHLNGSSGSVTDGFSTALKRHRPLMRQFHVTKNLNRVHARSLSEGPWWTDRRR